MFNYVHVIFVHYIKIIEHTKSRDDPGFLKPKLMFVMHASPSSTRSGRATVRSAASDPGKLPPTMPRYL